MTLINPSPQRENISSPDFQHFLKDSKSFKRVSTHFKERSGRVKGMFIGMSPPPFPFDKSEEAQALETLPGKG
jgi:hypothetical protein